MEYQSKLISYYDRTDGHMHTYIAVYYRNKVPNGSSDHTVTSHQTYILEQKRPDLGSVSIKLHPVDKYATQCLDRLHWPTTLISRRCPQLLRLKHLLLLHLGIN